MTPVELKLVHLAREVLGLPNATDPLPGYGLKDLAEDMAEHRAPAQPVRPAVINGEDVIGRLRSRAIVFTTEEIRGCPEVMSRLSAIAASPSTKIVRRKS